MPAHQKNTQTRRSSPPTSLNRRGVEMGKERGLGEKKAIQPEPLGVAAGLDMDAQETNPRR